MFTKAMLLSPEGDEGSSNGGSDDSQISEDSLGDEGGEEEAPIAIAPKMLKKLKLKFNGREIEEDLPFEIEEKHADWMTKQRQMAMLGQHKSQEYNQLEREVGAFIEQLRNPATRRKALSNPAIGMDIKEFAAQVLQEEIEESQKSPEQIREEELTRQLEELRAERETEKEAASRQELERLTDREFERYDNLMSSALESSDLPKSPYVVKKMTEYMIEAVENGMDIEPKHILPLIRNEMLGDVQEMLRSMPPEMVEQILGNDIISALRKNRVAASKKPPIPVKSGLRDVGIKTEKKAAPAKKETFKDFFGF